MQLRRPLRPVPLLWCAARMGATDETIGFLDALLASPPFPFTPWTPAPPTSQPPRPAGTQRLRTDSAPCASRIPTMHMHFTSPRAAPHRQVLLRIVSSRREERTCGADGGYRTEAPSRGQMEQNVEWRCPRAWGDNGVHYSSKMSYNGGDMKNQAREGKAVNGGAEQRGKATHAVMAGPLSQTAQTAVCTYQSHETPPGGSRRRIA